MPNMMTSLMEIFQGGQVAPLPPPPLNTPLNGADMMNFSFSK